MLFTDGVTEARNLEGDDLGTDQIGEALVKLHGTDASTIAASVNETVLHHVGDAENLDDDVTVVIVSRTAA